MNKISFLISVLIFSSSLTFGCAPKTNIHMQEAAALCDVYNPEHWKDFSQKQEVSYLELLNELANRISQVIVTPEFRNIFKELSETSYSPDLNVYTFYQERISKLTGTEWDCPFAKDFYSVEWKSEHITPGQPSSAASDDETEELVIRLEQNGDYVINSEKVAAQDSEKIDQVLKELLNIDEMPKVKVITADGVSKEQLLEAMNKLSHLGVKNVTIVTQGANPPKLD